MGRLRPACGGVLGPFRRASTCPPASSRSLRPGRCPAAAPGTSSEASLESVRTTRHSCAKTGRRLQPRRGATSDGAIVGFVMRRLSPSRARCSASWPSMPPLRRLGHAGIGVPGRPPGSEGNPTGTPADAPRPGRPAGPGQPDLEHGRARGASTHGPKGFNATDPAAYRGRGWAPYDAVVRGRGRTASRRFHDQRAGPAVGDRVGGAEGHDRLLPRRMAAVRERVRLLRQGRRHPLQRLLQARRLGHGAAARELLVDLERAELRLRHRARRASGSHQSIPNSPHVYRGLLDAAWSSLIATGHTHPDATRSCSAR